MHSRARNTERAARAILPAPFVGMGPPARDQEERLLRGFVGRSNGRSNTCSTRRRRALGTRTESGFELETRRQYKPHLTCLRYRETSVETPLGLEILRLTVQVIETPVVLDDRPAQRTVHDQGRAAAAVRAFP
jgi:hypothetical protein